MSEPPRPSPEGESFDQAFERLREKYRGRLRQQIEALGTSLLQARESEPEPADLEAARHMAHRMKGTSGSYGLDESCAAFARIEAHLDTLLEAAPADSAPIWVDIEQALQHALQGLD